MNLSRQAIENLIREVIREEFGRSEDQARKIDASGVIGIDPAKVALEPFPFPINADRVMIADVLSLEESPRLGCGVMEMDNTSFAWNLTYDEIDIVLEGALEIVVDGRVTRAEAGQIVFIPKNTEIRFSAPGHARFLYVCYPANWADQ